MEAQETVGWFDKIREVLRIDVLIEKIKESKSTLIDIGLFFGIGFLAGFLIKKYGQFLVAFGLFIGTLFLLQYLNFISISIHWTHVQEVFGIQKSAALEGGTLLTLYWEWIKANLRQVISFSVGFLIGMKVA